MASSILPCQPFAHYLLLLLSRFCHLCFHCSRFHHSCPCCLCSATSLNYHASSCTHTCSHDAAPFPWVCRTFTQLQNAIPTSNLPSCQRGREVSENQGKRTEPSSPPGNNRYHPYRPSDQVAKKPHKGQQSFQAGAGQSGHSACTLCLGHFRHPIHKCASEFLWDKRTKTRCRCNAEGHLVNPKGLKLCYDWQRPKGCSSTARSHVHECLGCGAKDHRAQECPQSENI
jgi:hypothetical protein